MRGHDSLGQAHLLNGPAAPPGQVSGSRGPGARFKEGFGGLGWRRPSVRLQER